MRYRDIYPKWRIQENPSPAHAPSAWESRRAIFAEASGKFNAGN
jgi:hypothetical protein